MKHSSFKWAVIGAGPAGIAALGKLIDHGIQPQDIAWIDPEFKVGDFGSKWQNVSSNTKVKLFTKFYHACNAFQFSSAPHFEINDANPEETCLLSLATQPLQWITDKLKKDVCAIQGKVSQLRTCDNHWNLTLSLTEDLKETLIQSKNIILATGADPKSLSFPQAKELNEIPLEIALSPEKLTLACDKQDTLAVFGSSHSAIIIIRTLLEECNIRKVINFYLEPLRYAVYFDDWILFDDTGLKGKTAEWARKHIDGRQADKLERIQSHPEYIQEYLPQCNKAIYATGFQKRILPVHGMKTLEHNNRTGIIAPGLFGVGIGFPEAKLDRYGTLEHRVGLWKFMEYISQVMPLWLRYQA
jgi:hypothetical protein